MTGSQSCPSGYPARHLVGTDVSYTCSACPCTVNATCEGTMQLFTDGMCMMGQKDIPADGMCHAGPGNASYNSYKYVGTVKSQACQAGPAPPPSGLALVGEETVCCAQ
jgi:hypothetical protein